jgi:hypothetical protein
MCVWHLGNTDAVHDQKRRTCLRAHLRVLIVGQRADIVENLTSEREGCGSNFRTPRVDRKKGAIGKIVPQLDKTAEPVDFFLL